jgi:transcriptional regulator with XRE-family HTH domain
MYYDAEYIARTKFYINDFLNREKLGDVDDIEARMLYRQRFPRDFEEAFQYLRVSNGISMKDMADKLGMNPITLKRWLESPVRYRNEDFLTAVCLVLKLPDWISRLLFKRASVSLDEDDRRHMALDYILRAQSCDGIKAANEYLNRHDFKILTF